MLILKFKEPICNIVATAFELQPLASVILAVYDPANNPVATEFVPPAGNQLNVYPGVPPIRVNVAPPVPTAEPQLVLFITTELVIGVG